MGPLGDRSRDRRRLWRLLPLLLLAFLLPALASAGAQAATLGGTIAKQDGGEAPSALAGATITAAAAGSGTPVATTTSDLLGGWLMTLPDGDYDVAVSAAGREPLTRRGVAVSGASELDATLVPSGYGRLFGTVVDSDGDPVPGVAVSFDAGSAAETVGAVDGSFSLAVPQTIGSGALTIAGGPPAESWTVSATVPVGAGEQRPIAVSVPPMTTLTARVLGRDDAPLEGIPVYLPGLRLPADLGGGIGATISNDVRSGESDANGEFAGQVLDHGTLRGFGQPIAAYPPPESFYVQASRQPPPIDGPTLTILRLRRFGVLTVHVRDADGQPLGAAVWSDPSGYLYGADVDLQAPEGPATVTISPRRPNEPMPVPRPWQFDSSGFVFDGAKQETLRLPPWEQSSVRVVDEQGDAVAGAVVTAPEMTVDPGTSVLTGTLRTFGDSRTTDSDGTARFDTFAGATSDPAAPGLVTPPAGSGLDGRSYAIEHPGGTTTVVLARKIVHVSGTLSESDGSAVEGATVTAADGTSATTLADGSFALDLVAGTRGLTIALPGIGVSGASVAFEEDTRLDLRLPPRALLTVAVSGDGGVSLQGATVQLPGRGVPGFDLGGGLVATVNYLARTATTDASGEAAFPLFVNSAPGFGAIRVRGPAGSPYLEQFAQVPRLTADQRLEVRLLSPATTPPVLSYQPTPVPDNGWWTVNRVTLRVTAVDSDQVVSLACAVDGVPASFATTRTPTSLVGRVAVTGEGRHLVACDAADVNGNAAGEEWPVDVDRSKPFAPTVAATRPADSDNGWWKDAVTVAVADDGDPQLADGSAGSGVLPQSVPGPQTFATSGAHTVRATVTDVAGLVSAVGRATVKVDADAPTTTLACPAKALRPGQTATARWRDADGESGVAGPATGQLALDTAAVGQHVVYHEVSDRVGHVRLGNCRYTVRYPFHWRGGLVDPPARNGVPAGATAVTLRFSLGGDHGLGVLTAEPSLLVFDCVTNSAIRTGTATVGGPLAYDPARGTYSLSWQLAEDVPAGSCAELGIALDDGTSQAIVFQR